MNNNGHSIPAYLRNVTVWSKLGYRLAGKPPADVVSGEALKTDNPWSVFAAVLEHAKIGRFEHMDRLGSYISGDRNREIPPAGACIRLIGDAGRDNDLKLLLPLLIGTNEELMKISAHAIGFSGKLEFVPQMLDGWLNLAQSARPDSIGYSISNLLESSPGEIADLADQYTLPIQPDCEFALAVRNKHRQLAGMYGENANVWRGALVSPENIAREMYVTLTDNNTPKLTQQLLHQRHKFESITGIELADCIEEGTLAPLKTVATLEPIIESKELAQFETGSRYFYGHRVPT